MSTISTINGSDVVSTSRTDINTNFSNLNTDKIETSVLDTDTTLVANSDSKIATQKAVKAYVDSGGQANASETVRGLVEEATAAEITDGTDTGGTGAKLFAPPSKLNTQIDAKIAAAVPPLQRVVGVLENSVVKTYFNVQLLFNLWTGAVANDTTTTFTNWRRSDTAILISPGGAMADFGGAGSDILDTQSGSPLYVGAGDALAFDNTNMVIMDWWAKLPASGTGDIHMGFGNDDNSFLQAYNDANERVAFTQRGSTGVLYATISNGSLTQTDISSGLTVTNWNNYRIELDLGTNAKFYVNGVLKATLSTNLYTGTDGVKVGFGRSNTTLFQVTAPNLALEMNP